MTIYNFGSINADYFYKVPHILAPGETLAATGLDQAWVVREPINL